MRHKRLKLSVILLLGFGLTGLQAQTMYVKEKSGAQTPYTLSEIRKLTFSSGNITMTKTSGSTDDYALTGIRYLSFNDFTTSVMPEKQDANRVLLFPNPVNDVLTIQYASSVAKPVKLEIISIDGKLVYMQLLNMQSGINNNRVNVSTLSESLYICRLNDGKTIQTIKFSKN